MIEPFSVLAEDEHLPRWDVPEQIAALYGELARITRSPVIELSRAVALAEAEGPQKGLELIDRIGADAGAAMARAPATVVG